MRVLLKITAKAIISAKTEIQTGRKNKFFYKEMNENIRADKRKHMS